ncbi:hypothetical protein DFP72DRAFT_1167109 [Ephemerocybe angulata]|uniref:Uncharacterized protein n=1 Tax=Ephemerocybe angulata TaxID=980116 RepID=A0A8H6HP67_9AGAR|nr:hypothetical protein DFP72DRAFT_1048915 [Tulosesus angulatus]KAF6759240.1 hypothetical protein DFP72DRAFT_1167109 [Tulosesus angulatus]
MPLPPGGGSLVNNDNLFRSYYLVAYWVEAVIFGMYCFLYVTTMVLVSRRKARERGSAIISVVGNTILFGLALFHNSLNVYRFLKAYAQQPEDAPFTAPVDYLLDYMIWDGYAYPVILHLSTWTGDLLAIYRCWIVWNRRYLVVVPSIVIILASLGTGVTSIYWFRHTTKISDHVMGYIFRTTLVLNLGGNTLTTGLIAFRIWNQHMKSRRAGIYMSSGVNLITLLRIIVESASFYTLEQLLLIALFYTGHPAIVIVQYASIPSTGIVFMLIAIRTHEAVRGQGSKASASQFEIPVTRLPRRHSHDSIEFNGGDKERQNRSRSTTDTNEHALSVLSINK